ncbi:hypothetical protein E3P77_03758 [Wallemia ichthyophaga]|nr:hypothetical protein E3P77_03758 [Wallemia ichthyophaga]
MPQTPRTPRTPSPPPIAIQPAHNTRKRRRMNMGSPPKQKRNAWIIYRTTIFRHLIQISDNIRLDQSKLSRSVSDMWRNENKIVRDKFAEAALLEKQGVRAQMEFDGEFSDGVQKRVREIAHKANRARHEKIGKNRGEVKKPLNAGRRRSQTLGTDQIRVPSKEVRSASVQPVDTNKFLETCTCSTDERSKGTKGTPGSESTSSTYTTTNTNNQGELGSPFLSDTFSFKDTIVSPYDEFTDLNAANCDCYYYDDSQYQDYYQYHNYHNYHHTGIY